MDNPDIMRQEPARQFGLDSLKEGSAFDESLWGRGTVSRRSRELTPLFAQRFVGPRAGVLGFHQFWELTFTFRGNGALFTRARRYLLRPNVAILIPPGLAHREKAAMRLDTLWVGFAGTRLAGLATDRIRAVPAVELAVACERLWLRGAVRQPEIGPELDGLTQALFAQLVRVLIGQPPPSADLIERALRHLHQNLAAPFHVAALADEMGCSEGHLHRLFKRQTGMTPVQYVSHARVETASRLLRESSLSVRRIAAEVGYGDPQYFARVFRKITGRNPLQARSE